MSNNYYLTFASNSPNSDRFKRIIAKDPTEARMIAFSFYGPKWAFLYSQEEAAECVHRYGLTELEPALTSQSPGIADDPV